MAKRTHVANLTKTLTLVVALAVCLLSCGCRSERAGFSFIVTCDMREYAGPEYQSSEYFLGTCQAVKKRGKGAFMISPGDIDPPQYVSSTIKKVLGDDYIWYPVVGNHEAETPEDMAWLRAWGEGDIPNLVRRGPANCEQTTYSFDYGNAHFAVLNQYYDGRSDTGTNGDVCDPLFQWLRADLAATDKPFIFVIGHEPIVSIPDADNGRHRHKGDNLDEHPENSHRFQQLLRAENVTAYICGHTHDFSCANINGVWQIDAAHCRGIGDTGAPSTFLRVRVEKQDCYVDVYRATDGVDYQPNRVIPLNQIQLWPLR
jgi:hypothetical protein